MSGSQIKFENEGNMVNWPDTTSKLELPSKFEVNVQLSNFVPNRQRSEEIVNARSWLTGLVIPRFSKLEKCIQEGKVIHVGSLFYQDTVRTLRFRFCGSNTRGIS